MPAEGKAVVVTGASMGIGEAIAKKFAAEGASVVLCSRDLARVEAARSRIGHPERTLAIACDVRKHEDIQRLLQTTLGRFGRVDVWVNNAGYGLIDSVAKLDLRECRLLFETNFFGVIDCMQAVVPVMRQQGGGAIINISSVAGYIAVPYMSAYGATKHALNCIGKAARMELRRHNINVLTVCPGYIATDFSVNAVRGEDQKRLTTKHRVTPDRVANAVFAGYLARKREIVVPWWYRVPILLYQRFPGLVESQLLRRLRDASDVIAEQQKLQETAKP
jgi:short-subunit dehydrogenase